VTEVDKAEGQAGNRCDRGHEHRFPLADPGGEDPGGNVRHDRPGAEERTDKGGDRGAGTAVDDAQRDDREHRPFC
jgi:hypothetical protein